MADDGAIRIRRAVPDDVAAITAIYNEAIATTTATFDTEQKSVADRAAWLAAHDDRHPVLVAERGGRVAGWVSLTAWSDRQAYAGTAEITYYVAAEARRQGVGRRLHQAIVAEAERQGFHTLLARITADNEVSVRLCEEQGFERIGTMREVGLKWGRLLDVHVLQKML